MSLVTALIDNIIVTIGHGCGRPDYYNFYFSLFKPNPKSRAASVEVLNSQSEQFRSRTNSTSTTTSSTATSCLTANAIRPSNPEPSAHRATIEPRPHFHVTNVLNKTATSVPSDGENKVRLPPLDSGPIFSRNRNRLGSSLTRYNSDTTMSQVGSVA